VDTVPAAHMITMTDNDNGINDENALPLPEDNLQGTVDAAARYHLAMSCVRRAIQYRAGSKTRCTTWRGGRYMPRWRWPPRAWQRLSPHRDRDHERTPPRTCLAGGLAGPVPGRFDAERLDDVELILPARTGFHA